MWYEEKKLVLNILIIKATRWTISQLYFGKQLYIFRTDLLSTIRSLNTVFTTNSMTNTICCEYCIKTPDDGQYVCPNYVELFTKIKFKISASFWLYNKNISRCTVLWMSNSFLTFWRPNYFFLILAHPVYKTWIKQEPNTSELWNKLHFEEKKNGQFIHV